MRHFYQLIAGCLLALSVQAQEWKAIPMADPTIFVENGTYYLTGTYDGGAQGFALLASDDLEHWRVPDGSEQLWILQKGQQTYGEKGFWAPQLLRVDGTYYLTYTANEQTALAASSSLTGPFRQTEIRPIDGSAHNIDSFLFRDEDGKYYLYHVRFGNGNRLWVAEFDWTTGSIRTETLQQCIDCTEAWENTPARPSVPIMEGPTVVKWDGVYYLFYSANDFRSIDYAVGYATAPTPYGPWTKQPDCPIIHRSLVGEPGSGHGDLFQGSDGQFYYVYHVHQSADRVAPRLTRIVPLLREKQGELYRLSVDTTRIIRPVWK